MSAPRRRQGTAGGDSNHPGAGTDSTQVGASAVALNDYSTALGVSSNATGDHATALGRSAYAGADSATAVGDSSAASTTDSTAVGARAVAFGAKSVAIGADCSVTDDYFGAVKVNLFEVVPLTGSETALILHDSAGVRWKVTVDTTGHLTTAVV